ncbi:hemagglutinin [Ralstonia wenshanensis]|uniref:two-partner secretion domain-containing protein n=1 Tax=Ralstonia wenshanensis TaxID=2842456 RepID=UPI0039C70611
MSAKPFRAVFVVASDEHVAEDMTSRHGRVRRSLLIRAFAMAVAVVSWLGPVQISWQVARQSAAIIAVRGEDPHVQIADLLASWRTTGSLLVRWGMQQADAAPITDPAAPIRFTPTITQTTTGVPTINVTAPNASGLSLNQLRSLTVDQTGLVYNNSLTGGGTFLGGNVAGNPNLTASGPASTILTQITSTDAIRLNGTVEVFGAPASLIFAAPGGFFLAGAGFTNSPKVTLSTGVPQFLNSSGASVPFDQATAVGYSVTSGRIQIDPVAGTTNGAGIEGTVGAINLIGQTIGVNAALYAGQQLNLIAGNQLVTPVATGTGRAGSDWQVSANGQNTAANSSSAQNGLAIDATAFGAMTSGQIKIVSTAQGLGVRTAADMAANTSNVNIDSNGNVSVGNVYAQQNVGINSAANVSTTGTIRAPQDIALTAGGDLSVGGPTQAGNNLTLNAGGNISGAGNLSATNALTATAGNSVNLGGNLNAGSLAVTAKGQDGTGDITLGGAVSSPGTIALNAARDTTIAGSLTGSGDLNLATQRNLLISGSLGTTSGNLGLAARTGSVQVTGSVAAPQDLNVTAGTDALLGGMITADRNVSVTAQGGSADLSGTLTHNGSLNVTAAQNASVDGQVNTGGTANLQAQSGNVNVGGKLVSNGALNATAGQDVSVTGSATSTSTITATAGRNLSVGGTVASAGDTQLTATTGTLSTSGIVQSGGNLNTTSQGTTTLGGTVSANQAVTAQSTGADVNATGALTAHGGPLTLTGAAAATVSGTTQSAGDTTITAAQGSATLAGKTTTLGKLSATGGQNVTVSGTTQSVGDTTLTATQGTTTLAGTTVAGGNLNASAGQDVTVSGTAQSGIATALNAGRDLAVTSSGAATSSTTLNATAGRNLAVAGSTIASADTQLAATGGTLTTTGAVLSGGNLSASSQGDASLGGIVYATKDVSAQSTAASVTVPGSVTAANGNLIVKAATDSTVSGTTVSAGNTTIQAAQGNATLGGKVTALGDLAASAGQDLSVSGTAQSAGASILTAGRDATIASTGSATAGTALTTTAGRNLGVAGATASGGDTMLTASTGALSTSGAVLSSGSVAANGQTGTALGGTVYAAQNVAAQSGAGTTSATGSVIAHSGNVALTGTNVAVSGATQSGGDTTLTATQGNTSIDGQAYALGKLSATATQDITGAGATASLGDTTLNAGRNIALTGSSQAAGNLTATAGNGVSIAALPVVGGNATLTGTNVSLGRAGATTQVNGTLAATGTQSVATAGTLYTNTANLTGGTVTNTGTVSASNTLTATGSTITNSGTLGGATTTMHGTNVANSGLIGGETVNVTADNSLNNQNGTLLGTKTLNVTTSTLASNQNGVIFAGDPTGKTAGGDLTLTVSGGNGSFNNAGGQSLAAKNATLNLSNQTLDSANPNLGTINAGSQLTYNVGAVNNTGSWTLGGASATVNAANGITNSGSIQHASDLTLNTPGAVSNTGQIVAGHDLTVSGGTVSNAAGATLHADNDLSVTGATTNRGTVEALNDIKIAGTGYDNAGALTQANRDVNINVSGDVLNQGGTIGAKRDVNLVASRVINDATAPNGSGTTVVTGQEVNPTYWSQIQIGTKQVMLPVPGAGSADGGPVFGPYTFAVTIGDLKPDANGVISAYQGVENYTPSTGGGQNGPATQSLNLWHLGGAPDTTSFPSADYKPAPGTPTPFITLPTVTRTETTTGSGTGGIIQAGRNLSVTGSTLSNNGGQISAANDIKMAVGTLNNGTSASVTKTITESLDQGTVNAFMQQLARQLGYNAISSNNPLAVLNDGCLPTECYNSGNGNGPPPGPEAPHWVWFGPSSYMGFNGDVTAQNGLAGFTATPPAPQTTVQQTAGKQGVIAAGGNIDLTQVGTLNNGGQIAAAGNISLGGSVNNVGQLNVNRTTLPGCVGNPATCTDPGVAPGGGGSPYHEVIDPKQQVASIIAGGTLTANLSQLTNQTATIAAAGPVQITAPTVTNTGATIQSTASSVTINAATSLVNQAAPTTTVYASHGSDTSACGKVGGTACATATQTATGDAGMILAATDLNINAGAVRNNGGAIVAPGTVSITTGSFDNSPVFLRQYYHWSYYNQNSTASDTWGCDAAGDISGCQRVFGGNLANGWNGTAENAPTIGQLNSYVSGGNLAIRSGGALINSGNIEGTAISLTGASISNGITNPSIQTPPSTSGKQVISLGPVGTPNAQLPVTGTPDSFSGPTTTLQKGVPSPTNPGTSNGQYQFNPVIVTGQPVGPGQAGPSGAQAANVQTPASPTAGGAINGITWHFNAPPSGGALTTPTGSATTQYLTNTPATAVLGGIGPQTLIDALPADLRPGSTPFYYDPQAENARLDQQALATTGRTSFINGLTYDNQNHLTVDDQEKLVLYQNAVDYAKAHNIQLGQALTAEQLAALDKPMLWYVTQQVPDPSCMTGACPMVSALVPQVYLPPGYSGIEPGGSIVASRSLDLIANNPIQNTGTLGSYGSLTSNTTIVNQQRAAEMTAAWQPIEDGWARTTGQQGQANSGFMFAANAADIAGQVQNVNGVLAQLNADGSMSAAEAARVAAAVQAGMQAVTSTHTDTFVRSPDIMGTIFAGVVMSAIAVMTGGALGPVLSGLSSGLVSATVAGAAAGAMAGSAIGQLANNDGINFGKLFTAGLVGAVTAGIANGITVNADGTLGIADQMGQGNTLANLAGAQSVPGTTMTQAAASTTTNLMQRVEAVLVMSAANAGVNTIAYGGSFGRSFINSLATNSAAIAAYAIGAGVPGVGSPLATPETIVANIGLHALAGCAASAAQGTGCGGGAVGAATSAILAPLVRDAQYSGEQTTTWTDNGNGTVTVASTYGNPVYNMVTTALATLAGGAAANALGYNAQAGANAGQNEALNNATQNKTLILSPGDFALSALQDMRDLPNAVRSFLSTPQHSAGNSNADPNNQLSGNNSNNLPPTAGAVATPWAMACTPNGPCVPIPPIVSPGSPGLPSNAIASSGNNTEGSSGSGNTSTNGATLPSNPSQLDHIFRDDVGHLANTPGNQQALLSLVNDSANSLGTDRFGNQWFAKLLPDGSQLWGSVRNGVIQNGGLNETPRPFNPASGLSRATK